MQGVADFVLVLASESPRRRELLLAAGLPHTVRAGSVDETPQSGESAVDYVRRVAQAKAFAIDIHPNELALAADTAVLCAEHLLGKPRNSVDADRMLRLLRGRRHEVITGVCLRFGNELTVAHESTAVWFAELSEADIAEYIDSGEPMDTAGAYAIQGIASRYIERIEGSYSNVVGLPIALVWRELEKIRSSLF